MPAVRLDRLLELESLKALSDEEMVNVQRANLLDSAAPNPSVETLLHAFLPHKFIDHTQATPFLALVNLPDAEGVMEEIFMRDGLCTLCDAWLDLRAPPLHVSAKDLRRSACFLASMVTTWGPDAKTSYDRVIKQTNRVEEWFAEKRWPVAFSGTRLSTGSTENSCHDCVVNC